MNGLAEQVRRAMHLGPRLAIEKGIGLLFRKFNHAQVRMRDRVATTYPSGAVDVPRLLSYLAYVPEISSENWPTLRSLVELYCEHRFDLLGSGWCQVRHGMNCAGVEGHRFAPGPTVTADADGRWLNGRINRANLEESQYIWKQIEGAYQPIDWHLDFKSGYRWKESSWHADTPFGHLPGVDIKVPWELSRMQHLPQMALAAAAVRKHCDVTLAIHLEREFRNQVLDFIACNPPRFGVNWRCAMDVGIRAANWLLAYDLFRAGGMESCPSFDTILAQSIASHGRHLIDNLEWQRVHRGNHYLADISGLLFVAAYLPCSAEVDAWLAFAVRQFVAELTRQFTPDGANFEASTSYHRLSAEMAVFGSSLILALKDDKLAALQNYDRRFIQRQPGLEPAPLTFHSLPDRADSSPLNAACFERLEKMAEFSRDVTKSDGAVQQVGDNDSGRFFKLWPAVRRISTVEARRRYINLGSKGAPADQEVYWGEDHLDHRGVVAAIGALVGREDLLDFTGRDWPEIALVRQLARVQESRSRPRLASSAARSVRIGDDQSWRAELDQLSHGSDHRLHQLTLPPGAMTGLAPLAYPDFGLFIWRGPRIYLAVRCGPTGQEGNGGHAHNDQLAIELQVDGEDWLADAGTYLYTPIPKHRNEYRSVDAHFAPRVVPSREPGRIDVALFQLLDVTRARCRYFGSRGFLGEHFGYGPRVVRSIELQTDRLLIRDFAESPLVLASDSFRKFSLPISTGYGIRKAA